MGVLLLAFILVIGFLFTHNYPPARYRQQRSNGWDSYFHVAQWGLLFSAFGLLLLLLFVLLLNFLCFLLSIPALSPWLDYQIPYLGTWLVHYEIHAVSVAWILALLLGGLAAYAVALHKKEQLENNDNEHMEAYCEVAKSDGLEELFYDAMVKGLMVLITLKSRKAYVGFVQKPRFMHSDTENVVIIPMISGYRDKDSLSFIARHSYIDYYQKHDITATSEPLTIDDFRTVMPRAEIESVSLFDADTFLNFEKVDESAEGCRLLSNSNGNG